MSTDVPTEPTDRTAEPGVSAYVRSLDCVHCGLCLPSCPTYDVLGLETDSPRGRLYLMRAMAEGRVEDPANVRQHLDQCLNCRACESVCPSGVRYGEVLEKTRAEMAGSVPRAGLRARVVGFLLARVVAHKRRLRLLFKVLRLAHVLRLDRLAARLRLLPRSVAFVLPDVPPGPARRPLRGSFEPEGEPRGRVALFTGCVMEQMFGDVNRATLELLLANGFAVDVPDEQVCCGALLVHDGQAAAARRLAERNIDAFADADVIVHNSAGCGAAMREYGHLVGSPRAAALASRCRDVCELLGDAGLTAQPAPFPHRVTYDDPCHLCHGQGVRRQPRDLLREVPGLELTTHEDPERCCGSAGVYNLTQPALAGPIGEAKCEAILASGAEVVATGNPGCMLQIRAHLDAAGVDVAVRHPVELLLPSSFVTRAP